MNSAGTPRCTPTVTSDLPADRWLGVAPGPIRDAASSSLFASLVRDAGPSVGSSCLSKLTLASALYPAESCRAAVSPRAVCRSAEPRSNRSDLDERARHSASLAPLRVAATLGTRRAAPSVTIGWSIRAAAPASWFTSSSRPPVTSAPRVSGARVARHSSRVSPPSDTDTTPLSSFCPPSGPSKISRNSPNVAPSSFPSLAMACCARTMT
mmetsp:Transcript_1110/g.4949  ORF Transcript_1110/g.4949 Transcript_1110/m.4949 type:complete len:210 (-) Transcript_1110:704-1333(-)